MEQVSQKEKETSEAEKKEVWARSASINLSKWRDNNFKGRQKRIIFGFCSANLKVNPDLPGRVRQSPPPRLSDVGSKEEEKMFVPVRKKTKQKNAAAFRSDNL